MYTETWRIGPETSLHTNNGVYQVDQTAFPNSIVSDNTIDSNKYLFPPVPSGNAFIPLLNVALHPELCTRNKINKTIPTV